MPRRDCAIWCPESRCCLRERGWTVEPVKPVWISLGGGEGATGLYPEVRVSLAIGHTRFGDAKDRDKEGLETIFTLAFVAPGDLEVACVSQIVQTLTLPRQSIPRAGSSHILFVGMQHCAEGELKITNHTFNPSTREAKAGGS